MTVWSSILSFYLTSYCDFLFQVKHSFLLLDQSGEFRRLEPRYHLRESQDLLVYEWEEMAGEFTHQVSHSIITPFLCFCALRLNTKACFLCTDLICFHDMKVTPPPHPTPLTAAVVKTGPDLAPAASLLGQLLRWSGPAAGSMIHFLSQHHELELQPQYSSDSRQICKFEWLLSFMCTP